MGDTEAVRDLSGTDMTTAPKTTQMNVQITSVLIKFQPLNTKYYRVLCFIRPALDLEHSKLSSLWSQCQRKMTLNAWRSTNADSDYLWILYLHQNYHPRPGHRLCEYVFSLE